VEYEGSIEGEKREEARFIYVYIYANLGFRNDFELPSRPRAYTISLGFRV
jgi:hypothetical protein